MRKHFQPQCGKIAWRELDRDFINIGLRIGTLRQHGMILERFKLWPIRGSGLDAGELEDAPPSAQLFMPLSFPGELLRIQFWHGRVDFSLVVGDAFFQPLFLLSLLFTRQF